MASLQLESYLEHLPKEAAFRVGIAATGISVAYVFGLVFYRLYLSPISKFPGPRIAAVTWWYELYYDVIHKGKYIYQIEKMHDKYGIYHSFPDDPKPCRAKSTAQYTAK
jgi:hypothetical protein